MPEVRGIPPDVMVYVASDPREIAPKVPVVSITDIIQRLTFANQKYEELYEQFPGTKFRIESSQRSLTLNDVTESMVDVLKGGEGVQYGLSVILLSSHLAEKKMKLRI